MQTKLPADILAVAVIAFRRLLKLPQQIGYSFWKRLLQDVSKIQPQRRGYASSNRVQLRFEVRSVCHADHLNYWILQRLRGLSSRLDVGNGRKQN